MIANSVKAVVVESIENIENITILVVNLGENHHWDMYQKFKNLPDVVSFNGRNFGKSCWNSDRSKAYYRSDISIAFAK